MDFKKKFSLSHRVAESARILKKYPDRVPVIVELSKSAYSSSLPKMTKRKFLVPCELTMGQFMIVIRKRIKLSTDQALFAFVGTTVPNPSMLLSELYQKNQDPDDHFLYVAVSRESVFGNIK
jgi:GABA(A) receptor-associated protein